MDDTADICPSCEMNVETKGVICNICERWYHYTCEKLSRNEIKMARVDTNSHYICRSCNILNTNNNKPTDPQTTTAQVPIQTHQLLLISIHISHVTSTCPTLQSHQHSTNFPIDSHDQHAIKQCSVLCKDHEHLPSRTAILGSSRSEA